MGLIYMMSSPHGKRYIGQTKRDLSERINGHRRDAKLYATTGKAHCKALCDATNKYGFDNFKIEVLVICADDQLNYYEKKFIQAYNTRTASSGGYGYNITGGGDTKKEVPEESRKRMSEAQRNSSVETRRKRGFGLPKYVRECIGKTGIRYEIHRHPKCKFKTFSSGTAEENRAQALAYLKVIDDEYFKETGILPPVASTAPQPTRPQTTKVLKPNNPNNDQALPKNVYKSGENGLRVSIYTNGKNIGRSFSDKKIPYETRLAQATAYVAELEQQLAQLNITN